MRKKDKQVVWGIVLGFVWVAVSAFISGCAIPLLTGAKEYEKTAEGYKVTFMTGADFHIGANGIDRVDDKRGIQPKER